LGSYNKTILHWLAERTPFITSFKVYDQFIVFNQTFPRGAQNVSIQNPDFPLSCFPAFDLKAALLPYLRFFTYFDYFAHARIGSKITTFSGGSLNGGPTALYDDDVVIIISSFSNFMDGVQNIVDTSKSKSLSFGIQGNITALPPNYSYSVILYTGSNGMNDAFVKWGEILTKFYGKQRSFLQNDISLTHLGYWTDNGAYYYSCFHSKNEGFNYQKIFEDLKNFFDREQIPVRYYQLDAWWYQSTEDQYSENYCIMDFNPRPKYFPKGLHRLQETLKAPLHIYSNYYCNTSVLRQMFPMIDSYFHSWWNPTLPPDQISNPKPSISMEFYKFLFERGKQWGMTNFEIDYQVTNYFWFGEFQNVAGSAREWLLGMGRAASLFNITIQYCMSLPRNFLQSVEIQAVTNIRASGDYLYPENYEFGPSSMLAFALGVAPSKDTFWTSENEPNNSYFGRTEPNTALQTLIAIWSTGPVGLGDGVGMTNKELVMKTCMKDGRLLQPDRPSTPIDTYYFPERGPQGEVWSTITTINGIQWHYILAFDMKQSYKLIPKEIHLDPSRTYFWKKGNTTCVNNTFAFDGCLRPFSTENPLLIPKLWSNNSLIHLYEYYYVVPRLSNGWILLGETNKFTVVSRQRFLAVRELPHGLDINLYGAPQEEILLQFVTPNGVILTIKKQISLSGQLNVIIT